MALFKNLHRLLLFLSRIFNGEGPGGGAGKAEGGRAKPALRPGDARCGGSAGAGFLSAAPRWAQMGMETIMQY